MDGDAAEIHEAELRLEASAHNVIGERALAFFVYDAFCGRAVWHALGHFLLIETLASHSVRAPFKGEEAVFYIRLELRKNRNVELGKIGFGVAIFWPENFIGMRNVWR